MRDTLRALRAIHLAPSRTAHAWFDGAAGASGGTATATPPAPADAATGAPPAADAPAGDTTASAPDLSTLQKELRDARREAASFRTKLKQYEDADAASKQAQMSEVEKLQAEVANLRKGLEEREQRITSMTLSSAVNRSASRLGFADPEDALALLDTSTIEFGDDGRPRNLDHLLGEILRAKPYLKASFTQQPDLGQGNRGTGTTPLTRDAIARMSPAEINARWDEVQVVMQKG